MDPEDYVGRARAMRQEQRSDSHRIFSNIPIVMHDNPYFARAIARAGDLDSATYKCTNTKRLLEAMTKTERVAVMPEVQLSVEGEKIEFEVHSKEVTRVSDVPLYSKGIEVGKATDLKLVGADVYATLVFDEDGYATAALAMEHMDVSIDQKKGITDIRFKKKAGVPALLDMVKIKPRAEDLSDERGRAQVSEYNADDLSEDEYEAWLEGHDLDPDEEA